MFLTLTQVKAASSALAAAARTFDCPKPRTDAAGNQRSSRDVAYGTHGAAFLQVDPGTLDVRCGACAGEMDATVTPKAEVTIGRRTHLVSR